MAKQYISKNNDFYIKDKTLDFPISLSLIALSYLSTAATTETQLPEKTKKAAKNTLQFFKNVFVNELKNYNSNIFLNDWNEDLDLSGLVFIHKNKEVLPEEIKKTILKSSSYYKLAISAGAIKCQQMFIPEKKPSKFLKPSDPGPNSKPDIGNQAKEQLENIEEIISSTTYLPEEIESVVKLGFHTYRGKYESSEGLVNIKISKKKLLKELDKLKNSLSRIVNQLHVIAPDLSKDEFKLKIFQGRALDSTDALANQEAYYLFTEKNNGGFMSLTRTRHSPPKYQWGISPAIENAYLFQSPLEDYKKELGSFLYNPAQVFVDMKFKRVECQAVTHPKIQAIQAVIEKKNLDEDLNSILAPKVEVNMAVAPAKKKTHKL